MRAMNSNSLSILDVSKVLGQVINEATLQNITSRMSLVERLRLKHEDPVKIGDYKLGAWKGNLPFYLFRCSVHGYVINYPIGYFKRLVCPLCINKGQTLDEFLGK